MHTQHISTILPSHLSDIAACAAARAMGQAVYKHPITGARILAQPDKAPRGFQRVVAGCDARHRNLQPTAPEAA